MKEPTRTAPGEYPRPMPSDRQALESYASALAEVVCAADESDLITRLQEEADKITGIIRSAIESARTVADYPLLLNQAENREQRSWEIIQQHRAEIEKLRAEAKALQREIKKLRDTIQTHEQKEEQP